MTHVPNLLACLVCIITWVAMRIWRASSPAGKHSSLLDFLFFKNEIQSVWHCKTDGNSRKSQWAFWVTPPWVWAHSVVRCGMCRWFLGKLDCSWNLLVIFGGRVLLSAARTPALHHVRKPNTVVWSVWGRSELCYFKCWSQFSDWIHTLLISLIAVCDISF